MAVVLVEGEDQFASMLGTSNINAAGPGPGPTTSKKNGFTELNILDKYQSALAVFIGALTMVFVLSS